MSKSEILLQEPSPHLNFEALVDSSDAVVYLYLFATDGEQPLSACWVRNLRSAPTSVDRDAMKRGEAPMLERSCCAHPAGAPALDPERLRFVWFEEGDGVALLEGDDILAIVPFWPGVDFPGYARDCTAESTLCWPLLADNVLRERVVRSSDYWTWWETNPWPSFQSHALEEIERHLGRETRYFAIDGDEWPPKAMVVRDGDIATLVTLGVALRRQPAIDEENQETARRIELAFAADRKLIDPIEAAQYISGQTNLPWAHLTFLSDGHTIPCDVLANARTKTKFGFVLLQKAPPGVPPISFDAIRGDRVDLLWMVPITAAERSFAEEKGSSELTARLYAAGAGGVFRERDDVVRKGMFGFFRKR
jgi:hypothetical protein